jgi:hypothetical protein
MKTAADRLCSVLESVPGRLSALGEEASSQPITAEKWSRKQVLGHLIDSASNNHQRFVRAQIAASLVFPAYAQNEWVATQHYQSEPWRDLVALWASYNRHLLHVIENIPADKQNHVCEIGENDPVTLAFLVEDYVKHMEHHLDQILK